MRKSWLAFLVVTFVWSWGWWGSLVLQGAHVVPGDLPTHLPGLAGPAIGAMVAAAIEGRGAFDNLIRRTFLFRISWIGWIAVLTPVLFLVAAVSWALLSGHQFGLAGLDAYPGVPRLGLPAVFLVALLANGFGEEMGWRGYALPRLQKLFGTWRGTLALFPIWALWHLPLYLIVVSFRSMDITMLVFGWGLGLFAGNLVLANVTHLARGSILAAALWHVLYNFSSATAIGGLAPAISTTCVMIWALGLVAVSVVRRDATLIAVSAVALPEADAS